MARFGRDLVRSLTQPAFGEGLFQVGEKIGGLPSRQRKEKETKGMMEEIAAAQAAGDRTALADIYERLGTSSGDPQYTLHAASLRNTERLNSAQIDITKKIQDLSNLSLSDEEVSTKTSELIASAESLNNPEILSSVYAGIESASNARESGVKEAAIDFVSSNRTYEDFVAIYGKENGYLFNAAKSKAIQDSNSIKANRESNANEAFQTSETGYLNQISIEGAKPADEIDLAAMQRAEQNLIDLAEKENRPVDKYIGIAQQTLDERITAEAEAESQAKARVQAERTARADGIVSVLMRSSNPLEQFQNAINNAETEEAKSFLIDQEQYISDEIQARIDSRESRSEAIKTAQIDPRDVEFFSDPKNFDFFAGHDQVENALDRIKTLEKKKENGNLSYGERSELNRMVLVVTDAVAKAKEEQRSYERSDVAAEERASEKLDAYLNVNNKASRAYDPTKAGPTPTMLGIRLGSRSLFDVAQDLKEQGGEEYSRLMRKLTAAYKQNPQMDFNVALKEAIIEMDIATPGEDFAQVRQQRLDELTDERRRLARSWVKREYTKNGKAPTEKEIDSLLRNQDVVDQASLAVEETFIARERQENLQREQNYRNMQRLRKTAVRGS